MSNHFYANGAKHIDHSREIIINGGLSPEETRKLVESFCAESATAEYAECEEIMDDDSMSDVSNHNKSPQTEELCKFIYPGLDDKEALLVHRQIKDLVSRFSMKDICAFLHQLAKDAKILQPQIPQNAFDELHRMGMPSPETKGFSYDNFCKYYRK